MLIILFGHHSLHDAKCKTDFKSHLFYIILFRLQFWLFLHHFLHSAFGARLHRCGSVFFSTAPQWCTLASHARAVKCVFALLSWVPVRPCTSLPSFCGVGFGEHCICGAASFSRASFLRLFVGGQLLRRAHLFSWWFSGWPFSGCFLISDFHLAPALLGSAAGTPGRRSIFGLHACI